MFLIIYLILFVPLLLFVEYNKKGFVGLGTIIFFSTIIIFPGFFELDKKIIFGIYIFTFIALLLDYKFKNINLSNNNNNNNKLVNVLGVIFFFLVTIDMFYRIISAGGLINVLLYNRLDDYLTGLKQKNNLMMMISILFPFGYLLIGSFLLDKKRSIGFILLATLTFYLLVTSNTRFAIVIPILACVLLNYTEKIKYKRVVSLFCVLLMIPLSVPFLIIGSFLRHGRLDKMTFENLLNFENIFNELNYNIWVNDLVIFVEKNQEFRLGYDWFVVPIINFIPRSLWNDKPLTSISNNLSEKIYLADIGGGDAVTTFTIYGEAYWQFWYLGFIILPIITFVLYRVLYYLSSQFSGGVYLYSIFLVKYFALVRAETPIFQLLYMIIVLYLLILLGRIKV